MKRGKQVVLIALFSAFSIAAGAVPFGTAQSDGAFEVHRGEGSMIERSSTTLVVQTGDLVVSRAEILSLRTTQGVSLAMSKDSELRLVDANTVELRQGQAALSATSASGMAMRIEDLEIRPLPAEAAVDEAQPGFFAVNHSRAGELVIYAVKRDFEIRLAGGDSPIALMTAGDTLRLTRKDDGWRATSEQIGQSTGEDSQVSGGSEVVQDDDDNKKFLGLFRLTPAVVGGAAIAGGAAVVVVGGTVYYEQTQTDDDKKEDDTPASPVDHPHDDWNWER